MTDGQILTIIAATGALITAIGGVIVNIIIALRTNEKLAEVNTKADIISGHVNGAATASITKIGALEDKVKDLTNLLSESKETAAVLAQSKSTKGDNL